MSLHPGLLIAAAAIGMIVSAPIAHATPTVDLGTADAVAVLAGSTVTNTGSSTIDGSVGVSPSSAITGFPPGYVTGGTIHAGDAVATQAHNDLVTAYNKAAGLVGATVLTGTDLGGLTLAPGIYSFASAAQLTGTLTLDAGNDPNATFVFQIGSTLTTASSSAVAFIDGGDGDEVFWQVGSSATLGTSTAFAGNILALTDITLTTSANISCGRALARNGKVTLDSNVVSIASAGCVTPGTPTSVTAVAEPETAAILGTALIALAAFVFRQPAPARRRVGSTIRRQVHF